MNNQNKVNLILFIAQTFSDEQCANILVQLTQNITSKYGVIVANNKQQWVESKHPRHNDGRFAPNGSGREDMTHAEAERWDRAGHSYPYDKRMTKIRAEISRLKRKRDNALSKERKDRLQSEVVQKQRELAELARDIKLERRKKIEGKVSSRILKKKVAQFRDLEEEIDYIEEQYADRNSNSPTQDQVVFPETKKGKKAKAKYERLKIERDELNDEIDWEMVDREIPEEDDDDE